MNERHKIVLLHGQRNYKQRRICGCMGHQPLPRLCVVRPLDPSPPHAIWNRVIYNCLGMHPLDSDSLSTLGSPNQVERLTEDTRPFISSLTRLFASRFREISKLDVHV